MNRVGQTTNGIPSRRTADFRVADGPAFILPLFALALLAGLLMGLAAQRFGPHIQSRRPDGGLPAAAVQLGYANAAHFTEDQARAALAGSDVLVGAAGAQRRWENAEDGNRGMVWAGAETIRADGRSCRDLEQRSLINNVFRREVGIACRDAAGGWQAAIDWHGE